ncbi:MAG: YheU family protein [Deltaproteobacteria bacterium]|nr:YheU family protein [Deltaproteobacteria bacterium]
MKLVEVAHDSLTPEALRGVIEEFVTRTGTDYGAQEKTIEQKIGDVERHLERGEATIVFDVDAGTTNIVPMPGRLR